jgi:predicted MFS family arabinose efflux permease
MNPSLPDSGQMLTLLSLLLGVIAYQLNASMVSPAVPSIARSLGTSTVPIALCQTMFFIVGGITGLVLARYSDYVGRKRVLLYSLVCMCGGTVLTMAAVNVPMLAAGRMLQGACGGSYPITYLILRKILEPQRFGPALGAVTAISGGVGGVDQFLGGFISDHWGFRAIFASILMTGILAVVLTNRFVPESIADSTGTMDWPGAAALSMSLLCVNVAVARAGIARWNDVSVFALFALAMLSFVAFWLIERATPHPLVKIDDLRSLRVWPLVATTFATLSGIFAALNFTVVLFSQDAHIGYGMSATASALMFLSPVAAIGLVTAPLAGWLAPRVGWRTLLRLGLGLSVIALIAATLLLNHRWSVFTVFCLMGVIYNGILLTTINGLGVILSPAESPGVLPGLNGVSFGIGAGLGITVVSPILAGGTLVSFEKAMWVSVAITAIAFVLSMWIGSVGDAGKESV